MAMTEVRKPKRDNPKYFANPKKYSESISFRQIAFEKFVKSTKQIQIRDFLLIYRALKTLDLADHYFFNPLERPDISGSNSQPKPRKVQISHSPGTDESKIPVSSPSFPF